MFTICLAYSNGVLIVRQMNISDLLPLIWIIISMAAMVELARLYYRIHTLENNFKRLLSALERASKRIS